MNGISEAFRDWLLKPIVDKLNEMEAKIMGQLEDLTQEIQDEEVEISTLAGNAGKVDTDIQTLLDKIAAGGTTMPDITAQLQKIKDHTAAIKAASDQLAAADTKANPPPPAP